jgi:hypothetical protein
MKFLLLILSIFFAQVLFAQTQLGMNDISILLPLPQTTAELSLFLNPISQENPIQKNELLPANVFKFLPILTPVVDQESLYQNNLKVIGIRFDPCFAEGFTPVPCQAQIRLVWQPIYFRTDASGKNKVNTIDAAVHTFYNLDQITWNQVIAEVEAISVTEKAAPLQVHPIILSEGFNGHYWKNLKNIVLKYAGTKNFVRATAMTIRMDRVWGFQGIDFIQNKWTQIEIPTLKVPNRPEARVVNQSLFLEPDFHLDLTEFKGGVSLMEVSNQSWFRLLSDSKKFAETQTEEEIVTALSIAHNLENPKKHNPGTIDCVSCHVAQTIRFWGDKHFSSWDAKTIFKNELYVNSVQNLKNTSVNPEHTNRLRAFGYFNDEPVISQRIINETAEILSR